METVGTNSNLEIMVTENSFVWNNTFSMYGLHANMDELAVPGSDYDGLVCAESIVSDHSHL